MSRRTLGVLCAAIATFAPALPGQRGAVLRARSDSLLNEWRQASAFADLQDSLRLVQALADRDTIRVGALTIIANSSPLPLAQAAALAWPQIEEFCGPAAQALARYPIVIRALDPDTGAEPPPQGPGLRIPWNLGAAELSRILLAHADLGVLDAQLQRWLGGPVMPGRDLGRAARVYVQLVTAPSRAVRRCFLGELTGCRDALSLSETADPVTRWYGPEERRALVTGLYAQSLSTGAKQATFQSCVSGSDASCLRLLEILPPGALAQPLSYESRLSLLGTAVQLGGARALQRLLSSSSRDMGQRLALASGTGADSLLRHWRAAVLAGRPAPVSLPPWGALAALGWAGVFTAFGLRSSRWRVS